MRFLHKLSVWRRFNTLTSCDYEQQLNNISFSYESITDDQTSYSIVNFTFVISYGGVIIFTLNWTIDLDNLSD